MGELNASADLGQSKVFVAKTIDGNIKTVMTNVDKVYINQLQTGR